MVTAVVPLDSPRQYFREERKELDALLYTAESGSAWTLVYPQFGVAVARPRLVRIPLAYAVRVGDAEWLAYVNTWIELKTLDGSFAEAYEQWILGRSARPDQPRWSVIREVLHWVD